MATIQPMALNDDHEPSPVEDRVLRAFKNEREDAGESRLSPAMLRDRLDGEEKQNVNYALNQLTTAGWVAKLSQGVYEYVDDPREEADDNA